jgi:hypothetical protein
MRIFKIKAFSKWATFVGLSDAALRDAVNEMEQGLIEADLGGFVVKKRVALGGRGKSGGARTLVAYKSGSKAIFVYGFAKNVRTNIKVDELKALKRYAHELMSYDDKALSMAWKAGELVEVEDNG